MSKKRLKDEVAIVLNEHLRTESAHSYDSENPEELPCAMKAEIILGMRTTSIPNKILLKWILKYHAWPESEEFWNFILGLNDIPNEFLTYSSTSRWLSAQPNNFLTRLGKRYTLVGECKEVLNSRISPINWGFL